MALLSVLEEQGIAFEQFCHPPVSSLDEQIKYADEPEQVTKNLFLKDKKNRTFLISYKRSTNVDLKGLAQRLGIGKGGVRCAPEETIQEVLQVSPVCVSPFALTSESQRQVVVLLDEKFKTASRLLFPSISNEVTLAVPISSLEQFLKHIGKDPIFVDFEAPVEVGKDQLPDLAAYIPASIDGNGTALESAPKKAVQNSQPVKDSAGGGKQTGGTYANTKAAVAVIMNQIYYAASSGLTEQEIQQNIRPRIENLLGMFKNLAYTEGFKAASTEQSSDRKL